MREKAYQAKAADITAMAKNKRSFRAAALLKLTTGVAGFGSTIA
jgi:hypothetical protein